MAARVFKRGGKAQLLIGLSTNNCPAQNKPDSTVLYRIETVEGNEFIGHIPKQDSAKIYLQYKHFQKQLNINTIIPEQIKNIHTFVKCMTKSSFFAP